MKYKVWDISYDVIDLTEDGIGNYAFDFPSATAFICEAMSHGMLILGGDIITHDGNHFNESYDNWYSNSHDPVETAQVAIDYLTNYYLRNAYSRKKFWVTITTNGNYHIKLVP